MSRPQSFLPLFINHDYRGTFTITTELLMSIVSIRDTSSLRKLPMLHNLRRASLMPLFLAMLDPDNRTIILHYEDEHLTSSSTTLKLTARPISHNHSINLPNRRRLNRRLRSRNQTFNALLYSLDLIFLLEKYL